MSKTGACNHTGTIFLVCALSLGLLPAGPVRAQPPEREDDLLDQVRRMEKVAAQKVEADLQESLREVQRLSVKSPAKALERLKANLAQLEDDTHLPQPRREQLKRLLKDRIRVTEADLKGEPIKDKRPGARPGQGQKTADNRDKLKQGLKQIKELQEEGKTEAASQKASEFARDYPHSKEAQAADLTAPALDQVARARKLLRERAEHFTASQRDIDRSATPVGKDMEFPKDWKERTANRGTGIKLTAKEREILKALSSPITVNWRGSRLEDVIEFLKTVTGQNIVIDLEALKEVDASYDSPVTLSVKGISTRNVLRKILADLQLNYVIKEEMIHVTSAAKARELMVVRAYYIGDVLAGMSSVGLPTNSPLANPFTSLNLQQSAAALAAEYLKNANLILEMFKSSVDPQSWREGGGQGTITYNAASMCLIVKQSAEVHALLGNSGIGK
jgi:hypothetical protein